MYSLAKVKKRQTQVPASVAPAPSASEAGLKGAPAVAVVGGERRVVRDMLDLFELTDFAGSLPRDLSGGQRQRVALARALVRAPDVLLLDEPFAALDIMLRDRVRQELADLQARFRIPLVVITHDVDDVKMFAETLVVYGLGQVATIFSASSRAIPTGSEQAYVEHYGAIDPRREFITERGDGQWVLCHEQFDERYVSQSEFYQDFLLPVGGRYAAIANLGVIDGVMLGLGMHRRKDREPFGPREAVWLERIKPHLQRAARLHMDVWAPSATGLAHASSC